MYSAIAYGLVGLFPSDGSTDKILSNSIASRNKALQSTTETLLTKQYRSPRLPLAVYREVAAHLRVAGVQAGLVIKPLSGEESFDYLASQIDYLWLKHESDLDPAIIKRIEAILKYYGDRYQSWEEVTNYASPLDIG